MPAYAAETWREHLAAACTRHATISRALHTVRRALPEGPERTAVRHALDDLTYRHHLSAEAERIADEQLDSEIEKQRAPGVTAWCRRAVAEYIALHPTRQASTGSAPCSVRTHPSSV
ncbi:hypothetical protein ACIBHX_13945 [Nonomuraea sp. NPDC050536]|uniref:hypothetical protein n=1 Tax=Nonomuraea sp. NPDC050536 TaxID=3364366 RepID=UPI0037C9F70E